MDKTDQKAEQKAEREAAQLAFFHRLAPRVPASFCDHDGASCSAEKHALILNGAQDEAPPVSFARALVMTVPGSFGSINCRCCRTNLVCDHEGVWEEDGITRWCMSCGYQEEV